MGRRNRKEKKLNIEEKYRGEVKYRKYRGNVKEEKEGRGRKWER